MTNRVFIWVGHPRLESLCAGMADAYQKDATKRLEVRRMDLSEMSFGMEVFPAMTNPRRHWNQTSRRGRTMSHGPTIC